MVNAQNFLKLHSGVVKNEKKNLWYAVVRFRNGRGKTMRKLGWNFEYHIGSFTDKATAEIAYDEFARNFVDDFGHPLPLNNVRSWWRWGFCFVLFCARDVVVVGTEGVFRFALLLLR